MCVGRRRVEKYVTGARAEPSRRGLSVFRLVSAGYHSDVDPPASRRAARDVNLVADNISRRREIVRRDAETSQGVASRRTNYCNNWPCFTMSFQPHPTWLNPTTCNHDGKQSEPEDYWSSGVPTLLGEYQLRISKLRPAVITSSIFVFTVRCYASAYMLWPCVSPPGLFVRLSVCHKSRSYQNG